MRKYLDKDSSFEDFKKDYFEMRDNLSWFGIDIERINKTMIIAEDIIAKSTVLQETYYNVNEAIDNLHTYVYDNIYCDLIGASLTEVIMEGYFENLTETLNDCAEGKGLDNIYFERFDDYIAPKIKINGEFELSKYCSQIQSGEDVDKIFDLVMNPDKMKLYEKYKQLSNELAVKHKLYSIENVDDTIKLNAEQAKIINELKNIMNKLDKPTIAKKQEPTLD